MATLTENVTAVCNEALAHLGMGPIDDIDVDTAANNPSALACSRFFSSSRLDVLREHQWGFANAQETLVEDEDTDNEVTGWDFIYTYPASAVAVWNVYNEGTLDNKHEQSFEVKYVPNASAKRICTNLEDAIVDETYLITDPGDWDYKFKEAFGYKLAAKMAHTLLGDPAIGVKLMEIYSGLISEAKRIGRNEKPKKPTQSSGYANAR
jgi:hypothetical protein